MSDFMYTRDELVSKLDNTIALVTAKVAKLDNAIAESAVLAIFTGQKAYALKVYDKGMMGNDEWLVISDMMSQSLKDLHFYIKKSKVS